jgi:hypothetical protein
VHQQGDLRKTLDRCNEKTRVLRSHARAGGNHHWRRADRSGTAGFAVQVKNAGNGDSDWEQDCQTCQDNAYAYCNAMWGSSYLLTPFYDICVAFNRLPCLIGRCHILETGR